MGIIITIVENNKKQQALRGKTNQPQIQPPPPQQAPTIPVQYDVITVKEPPIQHKFCPYCGKETSSEICPDCGKEID